MAPLEGTDRCVATDNFFTGFMLAEYLLSKRLMLVGTIRNNKVVNPTQAERHGREACPIIVVCLFGRAYPCVYIPKPKEMVPLILSTKHHDKALEGEEVAYKPKITTYYNSTKEGVDNLDKLVREYLFNRRINRWSLRVFYNLIDVADCNTFVI